ncbi:TolC family protein [bacterium]|nr:TolC family protein [bacterium]
MDTAMRSSVSTHVPRGIARAIAWGVLLVLPACQIPKLRPPEAGPPLPASYNGAASPESSAQLKVEEFFNDPVLVQLIYQGLAGNQELKILEQDIQIANNEILLRRGAYLPFLSLRTGAGLDRSSEATPIGAAERQLLSPRGKPFPDPLPDFLVAANISWQVDIWRKLRNARDAATLRYLATADGRNYVVTRLVADVADNYYGLLALDARLEVLDQTIAIQEKSLEIARARFEAGRGNELAVQRFEAEVRKNQSEKLIVKQDIIESENRINFLVGRYPQRVERPAAKFVDLNLSALSVGVPAQLLLNRPDVRQAERELEAAGLEVKIARAEFFPQLDITGTVGYRAFNPRYLFNPEALIAGIAGDLVTPLVNKAAIRAVYGNANARQLQAVYNYQRVVLDAYTEVINRVTMAENYRVSIEFKKQQLTARDAAVDFSGKLFQAGRIEYVDVRLAQRDLLDARIALIDTKRQQLSAVVNAYQALGGGGNLWHHFMTSPPPPGAAPRPPSEPQPQGALPQGTPPQGALPQPGLLPPPRPGDEPGQLRPPPALEPAPPPRPVPEKPKQPDLQPAGALVPALPGGVEWLPAVPAVPEQK